MSSTRVVASAAVLGTLMQTLFVPVLRVLPDRLGASPADVSWLVTAALVSGVVCCAVLGRLADMYGKRRMLMVALGAFVAGSVLGALTTYLPLLLGARALQGAAMAALRIGIGVLNDTLDGRALVRGLTAITAMSSVGVTAGAVVGGVIAELFSWRWLFVGSAAAGAVVLATVARHLPADGPSRRQSFDVVGAVGLAGGLVTVLIGISRGPTWGWSAPATIGALVGGAVVLGVWSSYEWRTRDPLIDLRVLAARPVLLTNLATLLMGFGMYGMLLAGPQLAQVPADTGYGLGRSVLVAGMLSLPASVVVVLTPLAAARIIDRRGARITLGLGVLLIVVAYGAAAAWHSSTTSLMTATALVLAGVGLCFSAVPLLLAEQVTTDSSGEANGVNGVFRIVGTSLSSAVVTAILTSVVTAHPAAAPTETAFVVVFTVCGVASILVLPLLAGVPATR